MLTFIVSWTPALANREVIQVNRVVEVTIRSDTVKYQTPQREWQKLHAEAAKHNIKHPQEELDTD